MAMFCSLWNSYVFLAVLAVTCSGVHCDANEEERKVYIVYMGALPDQGGYTPSSHHLSMLQEVVDGSSIKQSIVRSYTRSFNGFAANLTEHERQKLASFDGVVSVFPSRTLQPQTTRSWDFMGFTENVSRNPTFASDVIVGVIDTGIWPESESFSDEGFGPPPKKWKGACKGGKNFTCNNKIIGARYYNSKDPADDSARDKKGHGTHTASIAAGNRVKSASFYGLAQGTARGGVPSARIAAYKVCHRDTGCQDEDVLAAFNDAIADGVDIISVSLGQENAHEITQDSLAIGAFHAMERGVLTVHSAGNTGLSGIGSSVTSVAPWLLTVAASSIDRKIVDRVVLGNGTTLVGNAVNGFNLNGSKFSLLHGMEVTRTCDDYDAGLCEQGCLDSSLVKGKIVLCNSVKGLNEAQRAGAIGSIVPYGQAEDTSFVVPLPAAFLNSTDIDLVRSYIGSTKMPEANILKSESIRDSAAPVVASFSSKGPNTIIPEILKPDITAPGVDILAAYSPAASPSGDPLDKRAVKFSVLSGTSMSCPHAAGVAAYLKSLHPDWSPSAIKSALMTTAWPMNAAKNPDAEFGYGAGHIDPVKAANPGLVYETFKDDYAKVFCCIGNIRSKLRKILGDNSSCPKTSPKELNYPSMAVPVEAQKPFTAKFPRMVTNIGLKNSTYKAEITTQNPVKISVEPRILSFSSLNERKSFVVTVSGGGLDESKTLFASLVWFDGTHRVRSPIVVYTQF